MAHGPIYNAFTGQDLFVKTYLQNGLPYYTESDVKRSVRNVDFTPASTKNPMRPNGTRGMSNWTRYGGSISGVKGVAEYSYSFGGPIYAIRWHGRIASPGFEPGTINTPFPEGEIEAIRKALGKFTEGQSQMNVALREAKSTSSLLNDYYKQANRLLGGVVDAANRSAKVRQQFRQFLSSGWKEVPTAYLGYLFGMKPLADDLTNAVQVLQDRKQHDGAFIMTLRGKFKRDDTVRMPAYQSNINYVDVVKGNVWIRQTSRAVLKFQLPDWYWDTLPPVTFFQDSWQTTRLSFVLDWVLPVKTWIQGFEGLQLRPFFLEGSRSTLLQRELSGVYPVINGGYENSLAYAGQTSGGKDYSYQRIVMDEFPTAELLIKLPRLRNILGIDHLRVSSALLAQRLAKLSQVISRH